MRKGWVLGLVVMLSPSAWASDDLAQMNAVSRAWDRYAELSNADDPKSVELLSASSLAHFGFLRDAALYASTEQLRRLPSMDRLMVYLLRASQTDQALKAMDDRAVASLCVQRGWSGVDKAEGEPLLALSHVTVVGDYAVSEVAPPTESQFQFGPDFDHEADGWKYRYLSLVPDSSALVDRSFNESAMTSTQLFEIVIAKFLKVEDAAPSLATLDRPLLDDSAQRVRLNERWPDYASVIERRIGAMTQKAQDGDPLAQLALASFKLSGSAPQWVKKDEPGGVELLEKASEGGNATAAELLVQYLVSDTARLDEPGLIRIARHVRRAAEAGRPTAMSLLGTLYFEGSGGLARDCRQAAEWQARAEEAGAQNARNDQVWTWATCPRPDQRDPQKALSLVEHMIKQVDTLQPSELDTVAAAMAANGRFDDAIQFQQRAIDGLSASAELKKSNAAAIKRMQARLSRYRKGVDYVQDYNTFAEMRAARR